MKTGLTIPFLAFCILNLSTAVVPQALLADGGCDKGNRPITPSEQQTVLKLLNTCKAVLPSPPKGWSVNSESGIEQPNEICRDYEKEPWRREYRMEITKTEGVEQRQAQRDKLIQEEAARMTARQPENEAYTKKVEALSLQFSKAATAGNTKEVDRLDAEMKKLGSQMETQSKATEERLRNGEALINKDTFYSMDCHFNARDGYLSPEMKELKLAHANLAFRGPGPTNTSAGSQSGLVAVTILIGNWKPDEGATNYKAQMNPKIEGSRAQSLVLNIVADESRVATLLESVNLKPLVALIQR